MYPEISSKSHVPWISRSWRSYSTGTQPVPRPATFRARPFLFISTFLLLHQSLATASLIPSYSFFRATDSSTSLLAGPYAAFILHQRVPWPFASRNSDRKVEDVVEDLLRGSVSRGWGLFRRWKGNQARGEDNGVAIAEQVIEGMQGDTPKWKDRVAGATHWLQSSRGKSQRIDESVDDAVLPNDSVKDGRTWKNRVVEGANNVRLKDVMDIAAAYLLVKVCLHHITHLIDLELTFFFFFFYQTLFPVRLGVSLYFAPGLARAFARRWP
jgi:hypothetical protein